MMSRNFMQEFYLSKGKQLTNAPTSIGSFANCPYFIISHDYMKYLHQILHLVFLRGGTKLHCNILGRRVEWTSSQVLLSSGSVRVILKYTQINDLRYTSRIQKLAYILVINHFRRVFTYIMRVHLLFLNIVRFFLYEVTW